MGLGGRFRYQGFEVLAVGYVLQKREMLEVGQMPDSTIFIQGE